MEKSPALRKVSGSSLTVSTDNLLELSEHEVDALLMLSRAYANTIS